MGNKNYESPFPWIPEAVGGLIGVFVGLTWVLLRLFIRNPLLFIGVGATGLVLGFAVFAGLVVTFHHAGISNNDFIGFIIGLVVMVASWVYLWTKSKPPTPALNGIRDCDKKKDFESRMICLTKKIDAILQRAFVTDGKGTHEHLDSAKENGLKISEYDEKKLRKIASIRNRAVHEDGYEPNDVNYNDLRDAACKTLVSLQTRNDELEFLNPTRQGGKLLIAMYSIAGVAVIAGFVWWIT